MAIAKQKKGAQGLVALKSYAKKYTRRKELEAQVEKLKVECNALMPAVLRYFELHGIDRQTVDGHTVAPRYELWASREDDVSAKEIHDALIDAGLSQFANETMNHQTMSAYIREIYRELVDAEAQKPRDKQRDIDVNVLQEEILARHPELEHKLTVREDMKISVTKAKKSTARGRIKDVLDKSKALPREVAEDVIG